MDQHDEQPEDVDLEALYDDQCQPIGCDHGHHLPGCKYAEIDEAPESDPLYTPGDSTYDW